MPMSDGGRPARAARAVAAAICLAASPCAALSPSDALRAWREARLGSVKSGIDASRYHLQLLFVDDDNERARVAQGAMEQIAEWADAGWWLYPHAASIAGGVDGEAPPRRVLDVCDNLGLCPALCKAPGAKLDRTDLDAYDLVIAVDGAVRDAILAWLADDLPADAVAGYARERVCLLTDFVATECAADPAEPQVLPPRFRDRVAPFRARAAEAGGVGTTRARPRRGQGAMALDAAGAVRVAADGTWPAAEAAMLLACAGLTRDLKVAIDAWFEAAYVRLLGELYHRPTDVRATWAAAEPRVRQHTFTGALGVRRREELFEEHMAALRARLGMEPGEEAAG